MPRAPPPQSSATSLACASVDCRLQQKLTSASPLRFSVASSRRISSVSPLAESAITTSPGISTPRSPCTASAGCRNSAGDPVELSVAAIFCAIMPLLPIPVTTTRPLPSPQRTIRSTARSNSAAIAPSSRAASASQRRSLRAHQLRRLQAVLLFFAVHRFLMVTPQWSVYSGQWSVTEISSQ